MEDKGWWVEEFKRGDSCNSVNNKNTVRKGRNCQQINAVVEDREEKARSNMKIPNSVTDTNSI